MGNIRTPCFWITQGVDGMPKPWDHFHVDNVMVNAYEILRSPAWTKRVREDGIHKSIGFDGPIMMDSGGFLLLKKKMMVVKLEDIVDLYEKSYTNYCVALDCPVRPSTHFSREREVQKITLGNLSKMMALRKTNNPYMVPVIHGSSIQSVEWFVSRLEKKADFDFIGVGSLVPSLFKLKGALGIRDAISIIAYIRKRLPEATLHTFGVGSMITMHLMFLLGIDSIDSSAWRTKAAYGAIQLRGVGDRYITSNRRSLVKRKLSKDEKHMLEDCRCPGCRGDGLRGLRRSFRLRALHNAWVFQQEVSITRRMIRTGKYENYARDILRTSRYRLPLQVNGYLD